MEHWLYELYLDVARRHKVLTAYVEALDEARALARLEEELANLGMVLHVSEPKKHTGYLFSLGTSENVFSRCSDVVLVATLNR